MPSSRRARPEAAATESRAAREDPALVGTRPPRQQGCCFEKSASQPGHPLDELLVQPIGLPRPREVLGLVDKSPENGHLRPNAGQSKVCGERAVVVGLQRREREGVRASPCA